MSRLLAYMIVLGGGQAAADLTPPVDLTATANGSAEIDLAWSAAAPDATLWSIERSLSAGSGYSEIDTVAAPATSYEDATCGPATEYFYRIRATDGATYGEYSNVDSDTTDSAVARITWTDNDTANEDLQSIERDDDGGGFVEIDTVDPGIETYDDTITAVGTYTYRVRTHNAAGYSDYSNEDDITI